MPRYSWSQVGWGIAFDKKKEIAVLDAPPWDLEIHRILENWLCIYYLTTYLYHDTLVEKLHILSSVNMLFAPFQKLRLSLLDIFLQPPDFLFKILVALGLISEFGYHLFGISFSLNPNFMAINAFYYTVSFILFPFIIHFFWRISLSATSGLEVSTTVVKSSQMTTFVRARMNNDVCNT